MAGRLASIWANESPWEKDTKMNKEERNERKERKKYERIIKINIQQSHHRMVDRCG